MGLSVGNMMKNCIQKIQKKKISQTWLFVPVVPAIFLCVFFFFFNDTATTEIYTLSLHDALPIYGASGPYSFEWELKSVNAKGLDVRVRLPQGWDEVEAFAKKRATEVLSRGTVYANLTVKRTETGATVRINEDVLAAVVKVASSLSGRIDAVAPSIDGLLSIKGVIEEIG